MTLAADGKCFACGADNPIGLKLQFECEGDDYVTRFLTAEEHSGWAGLVHGGLLATLLDEVMVRMTLGGIQQNRVAMRFEYARRRSGRDEIVARGEQEVACMRREGSRLVPVPPPDELREALRPYEGDVSTS